MQYISEILRRTKRVNKQIRLWVQCCSVFSGDNDIFYRGIVIRTNSHEIVYPV